MAVRGIQARDANTRAIAHALEIVRARGIEIDDLCDGLSIELAHIERPGNWLVWEDAAELMDRIEVKVGGPDALIQLWGELSHHPLAKPMWKIARFATSLEQLYRLTTRYATLNNVPIHSARVESAGDHRIRIELSLPRDRPGSEAFFRAAQAFFITLPRSLGLAEATVEARIQLHSATYLVDLPRVEPSFPRLRRIYGLVTAGPDAAEVMIAQQSQVEENYRSLERAHRALEEREAQLHAEIEDRRRAESELREREHEILEQQKLEALWRLSGGIAHDFNNVLTIVSGCTELLASSLDSEAKEQEFIDDLQAAVARASSLTKKLSTLSRPMPSQAVAIDLNELVGDVLDLFRPISPEISVKADLDADPAIVQADPVYLEQVALNLLLNARDAMEDHGGLVRLRTERFRLGSPEREWLRLSVEDNGIGMPQDVLTRIFEPFFSTKGTFGTGLGLATARRIVEQSGGRITVESAPGRGSKFRVDLPATRASLGSTPAKQPAVAIAGAGQRILLIEDEDAVRRVTAACLEQNGYRVYPARGGVEACRIALALPEPIDLVVCDVMLGHERGPDVVQDLRREAPDLPALLVSGLIGADVSDKLGDLPLLEKPFGPAALLARIHSLLETAHPDAPRAP